MSSLTDSKLSQDVIEVLGYLAYEMVREVSESDTILSKSETW